MSTDEEYDVLIAGGGVTGTAFLWVLAWFTSVRRILLIERRHAVAQVNSNVMMNAQTLHKGPQETNYSLEKALKVGAGAKLLAAYLKRHARDACKHVQKMVIGCGAEEVAILERRYAEFKPHFPELRLLRREEIAAVEPKVTLGRDPGMPIVALYDEDGYAVNYQRVAESFQAEAAKSGKAIDVILNREIESITRAEGGGFVVSRTTNDVLMPQLPLELIDF